MSGYVIIEHPAAGSQPVPGDQGQRITTIATQGFSALPHTDICGRMTIGYGATHTENGDLVTKRTRPTTIMRALIAGTEQIISTCHELARGMNQPPTMCDMQKLEHAVEMWSPALMQHASLLRHITRGDYRAAARAMRTITDDGCMIAARILDHAAETKHP